MKSKQKRNGYKDGWMKMGRCSKLGIWVIYSVYNLIVIYKELWSQAGLYTAYENIDIKRNKNIWKSNRCNNEHTVARVFLVVRVGVDTKNPL